MIFPIFDCTILHLRLHILLPRLDKIGWTARLDYALRRSETVMPKQNKFPITFRRTAKCCIRCPENHASVDSKSTFQPRTNCTNFDHIQPHKSILNSTLGEERHVKQR